MVTLRVKRLMNFVLGTISCITITSGATVDTALASDLLVASSEPMAENAPLIQNEWRLIVSPYTWATSLNGDASALGHAAHIDDPFSETLKNLDFAVMGSVEITNGVVGAFFNGEYTNVSTGKSIGPFDVGVDTKSTLIALGAYYHVYEAQLGGNTVAGAPRLFTVAPTAGLRWTRLEARLDVDYETAGFEIDRTESWVDPFIGTRVGLDLSDRWNLTMEGDVGGFGAGSKLSLNGQAYLGYRTTIFEKNVIVRAGYRAFYQDYENDDFHWKVTQHGPIIGYSMEF